MTRFAAFFFVLVAFASVAPAWETDNFTCRSRDIADGTDQLNAETNRRLKKAADLLEFGPADPRERYRKLNEIRVRGFDPRNAVQSGGVKTGECSKQQLYDALEQTVASPWTDNLETWSQESNIPKCKVPVGDSVFSAFDFKESMVAKSAGINPVISVNGTKLGVDKLSHFMTEGYNYFRAAGETKNIERALEIGIRQEEGGYGWKATGVKSYGDMAANYKGMTFWENVAEGANPYFKCVDGRWRQVRDFDWRDYVDDSLDESVNCNEYKTEQMNRKAAAEVSKRWKEAGLEATGCPATPDSCRQLAAKIKPEIAMKTVLHPSCLSAADIADGPRARPKDLDNDGEEKGFR